MNFKDLSKKLHSLKDLRLAIREVKSLAKDASVTAIKQPAAPKPAPMTQATQGAAKDQQRTGAKEALTGNVAGLKHSGVKTLTPGVMTHQINLHGAPHGYEIHVNMHDLAAKKPAFTVAHVNSLGTTKSQSPIKHDNIQSAVKHLVHHAYHGKWEP